MSRISFQRKPFEMIKGKDVEDFLSEIEEDLDKIVPDDKTVPRLKRNFGGKNVFVQTNDYNAFIKDSAVTFHGFTEDMYDDVFNDGNYQWDDEESREIIQRINQSYRIADIEDINW